MLALASLSLLLFAASVLAPSAVFVSGERLSAVSDQMVFEPVVVSQCVEDRRLVVLAPMMLFARLLGLARCS